MSVQRGEEQREKALVRKGVGRWSVSAAEERRSIVELAHEVGGLLDEFLVGEYGH